MGRAGSRYPKCVCPISFTVWEWHFVRRNHLGRSEVLPWTKPLLQMDWIPSYEEHTSGKRHRAYIRADIIRPDGEILLVCREGFPMTPSFVAQETNFQPFEAFAHGGSSYELISDQEAS
jgi:hypothetical protein